MMVNTLPIYANASTYKPYNDISGGLEGYTLVSEGTDLTEYGLSNNSIVFKNLEGKLRILSPRNNWCDVFINDNIDKDEVISIVNTQFPDANILYTNLDKKCRISYNNKDISEEESKKLSSELANEGMISKFEYAHDCFYTMEVKADNLNSIYDTITDSSGNVGKVRNAKTIIYDGIWNVIDVLYESDNTEGNTVINTGMALNTQIASPVFITTSSTTLLGMIDQDDGKRTQALKGDANGNKLIDAVDASIILANYAKYSTSSDKPTESELVVQDVNGDEFIDAVDASMVLSYYAYVSAGGNLSFSEYLNDPKAAITTTTAVTTTAVITTTTTSKATAKLSGELIPIPNDRTDMPVIRGISLSGSLYGSEEFNSKKPSLSGIRCIFGLEEGITATLDTDTKSGIKMYIFKHKDDQSYYETANYSMPIAYGVSSFEDGVIKFSIGDGDGGDDRGYYDMVFVYDGTAFAKLYIRIFYNELINKSDAELEQLMNVNSAEYSAPIQSYEFNAKYVRTYYTGRNSGSPKKKIFTSRAELDSYVNEYKEKTGNLIGLGMNKTLEEEVADYDDNWFSSSKLVMVILEESSGSISHKVVQVDEKNIKIERIIPMAGTCDMAEWHIFIELDKELSLNNDIQISTYENREQLDWPN